MQSTKQLLNKYHVHPHIVAAYAIGLLLGIISVLLSAYIVLFLLAAGIGVFAALKRPEIALFGILIATSSIVFEERLPLIPIGFGSLHIPDVILLCSLSLVFLRWWVEADFKLVHTPLDKPLLAFFTIALISTTIAVLQSSVDFESAMRSLRIIAYYLTYFVVTNLIREDQQLHLLLRGLSILGTVVAVGMIAQYTIGDSFFLLPGRVETLRTQGTTYAGITRILPPGQSLVLLALINSIAALIFDERSTFKLLYFIQIGLLGTAVVLTFNRSFWVSVAIAVIVLAYVTKALNRRRLIGLGLIILVLIVVVVMYASIEPRSQIAQLGTAFFERFLTLGRASTLQESSLEWRYVENEYVLPNILSQPLFGLGLGSQYRPFDPRIDYLGREWDARRYIHNGHFWIMLKTGLLGYLSLATLSVIFLVRSFKYWRQIPDPLMQGNVLSFTITYLGILVAAIVSPIFIQWFWTPVLGIMMGINEVVLRRVIQE